MHGLSVRRGLSVRSGVHNTHHPAAHHNWIPLPHHPHRFHAPPHPLRSGYRSFRSGNSSWHGHAGTASYLHAVLLQNIPCLQVPASARLPSASCYRIQVKASDHNNLKAGSAHLPYRAVSHHNNTGLCSAPLILFWQPWSSLHHADICV